MTNATYNIHLNPNGSKAYSVAKGLYDLPGGRPTVLELTDSHITLKHPAYRYSTGSAAGAVSGTGRGYAPAETHTYTIITRNGNRVTATRTS